MEDNRLEINASRQFTSWLYESKISLAFSTYQAGKLFMIGLNPEGRISVFERNFERCMGLLSHGNGLYLSTLYQIWRMENILEPGQLHNGYDALYVPQVSYVTGDVDAHDLGIAENGRLIFANTLFSCIAEVSETHSFKPIWNPSFITRLSAEDRCHLNGLAMRDGKPAFTTAVSTTDIHEGWREHRQRGGVAIDVEKKSVICGGFSMPHSPRWYQGKLWLHDSGNGYFGYVDFASGKFEKIAFCPGYLRGLAFHGDFAVVGLSRPRNNKTFEGLALEDRLKEKNVAARCGLQVIDLKKGDIVHSLSMEGIVEEIYDVVVLSGIRRPSAIGFKTEEIRRTVSMG